jgi:hypothetical protein
MFCVTVRVRAGLDPHTLLATTDIVPPLKPALYATTMMFDPCPLMIDAPVGTDHVYVVARATFAIEYVAISPGHALSAPEIDGGVTGAVIWIEIP